MASPARRLPTNAPGPLYVDDTCIDCGTCRWMAPETFDAVGDASRVHTQPAPADRERAARALVACPTASIGVEGQADFGLRQVARSFPAPFALDGVACERVSHCGYHHRDSYGAASWLVDGTSLGRVMVDSPRLVQSLARKLRAEGGVDHLFLTHRDDVADHERIAAVFGCPRTLHEGDVTADTRTVEHQPTGIEPLPLAPGSDDLLVIPTPGHTRGSACLLVEDRVLFTGDTLAWSPDRGHVVAFRRACWHDWDVLIDSVERLRAFDFTWLIPGHGAPCRFDPPEMKRQLEQCLRWMRRVR